MTNIRTDLIHLFYPNLCKLCKKPLIHGEEQICLSCLIDLPHTDFHKKEYNLLEQFFADKKIERAYASFYYEKGGPVQKLIHSLKYHNNRKLGYLLGKHIAFDLQNNQNPICNADLLIPVPLHPNRKRKRGYNQSEWIARGINTVLQIPVDTVALQRIKKTDTQTNKSVYNRWLNVQDMFTVTNAGVLTNKHIILVDDVITTGATVKSCIDTLAAIPDIKISVLSAAFVSK